MNYKEMLSIISKPWLDVNDIKLLACCGRDKSAKIRDEIRKTIFDNGKKIPQSRKKIVPTQYVIKYLGLDIKFIQSMANI